jgi:hypothetical protein
MLRWIFFALIAINLGYFLWSGDDGQTTGGQREPQRLGRQVRPEMLQIRKGESVAPSMSGVAPVAAAAPAPATNDSVAR